MQLSRRLVGDETGNKAMRKFLITGALVAAAAAAPASAQLITFNDGVYTIPAGINAAVFEEFENSTPGADYNPNTQSSGARPESVSGRVIGAQGNVPSSNVVPDNDGNKYLAIQSTGANPVGTFSVNLAPGVTVFSFVFGSLDSYNSLELFFDSGVSKLFTGQEIIGGPAPVTNPSTSGESGRVTFDTQGVNTISSAVFRSTGYNAFEIDALAAAVPEPATWGLMIFGFGVIGGQLRSRRRAKTTVSFA